MYCNQKFYDKKKTREKYVHYCTLRSGAVYVQESTLKLKYGDLSFTPYNVFSRIFKFSKVSAMPILV